MGTIPCLTQFLKDGRLELDIRPVENARQAGGSDKKNALFSGHEVGPKNWPLLASVMSGRPSLVFPKTYRRSSQAVLDCDLQSKGGNLLPLRFAKTSGPEIAFPRRRLLLAILGNIPDTQDLTVGFVDFATRWCSGRLLRLLCKVLNRKGKTFY